MKKKRTIIVLITGIIFGLIISGIGTYAATTYAISSNKVSYTDNSSLGVNNVQAAIDGTCSNVNNRLSSIDDKLKTNKVLVTSFNSGYTSIGDSLHNNYYAKISDVVIVNVGVLVNTPSITTIFTIPTGYRASQQVDAIIWQEGSYCMLTVKPDGSVIVRNASGYPLSNTKVIGTITFVI